MNNQPQYSTLFSCLHDEPGPVGNLGRGTHYSVMRSVEWLDVERKTLKQAQVHDFAVIWDEDHDERVIEVIEKIYMAGLLSPVQFIGERKGGLSIVLAAKFFFGCGEFARETYYQLVSPLAEALGDEWPVELGSFDRHDMSAHGHQTQLPPIINDKDEAVFTYLKNIDNLWRLGTRDWHPRPTPAASFPPPLSPGLFPPSATA